jgi:hypothetical protein
MFYYYFKVSIIGGRYRLLTGLYNAVKYNLIPITIGSKSTEFTDSLYRGNKEWINSKQ